MKSQNSFLARLIRAAQAFNKIEDEQPVIEFFCAPKWFGVIPEPVPARKTIPAWFKNIPTTTPEARDHFGAHGATAKKCMPLLDVMSLGFTIPLWGDVNIRTDAAGSFIESSKNPLGPIVDFHPNRQLGGAKNSPTGKRDAVKFINHWIVKTAPGYSTLFLPAINHLDKRFTLLAGLVDTDTYQKEVNFPGIWHSDGHDAVVSAGTPLVTCIPIRRSDMLRDAIARQATDEEMRVIENIHLRQQSRSSVYTSELREQRK